MGFWGHVFGKIFLGALNALPGTHIPAFGIRNRLHLACQVLEPVIHRMHQLTVGQLYGMWLIVPFCHKQPNELIVPLGIILLKFRAEIQACVIPWHCLNLDFDLVGGQIEHLLVIHARIPPDYPPLYSRHQVSALANVPLS